MQSSYRILIVDDNSSIHEDIRNVLIPESLKIRMELNDLEKNLFNDVDSNTVSQCLPRYIIEDAYQGETAIEMIKTAHSEGNPYSLVFMDVRMPPGIDGITATKSIWDIHPQTEIVIITAYSDYSWEQILSELGITDRLLFLRKPFDSVSLKQSSLTMCTKWSLNRQNRDLIVNLEQKIQSRTKELRLMIVEKEAYIRTIRDELEFAETVQRGLLPEDLPVFDSVDFAIRYIPTGNVGGDYYDVVRLPDDKIAITIFDAAGHGIAAALVMALGKSYITTFVSEFESPAKIIERVNNKLFISTPTNMFITAFLMIIDCKKSCATYCNAGHIPPIVVNKNDVVELSGGGPILGILEEYEFIEKNINLKKNDLLLFYTDGLIESMNLENEQYGRDRVKELLLKHSDCECDQLLNKIMESNHQFIKEKPRDDDLCMIALKYKK